MAHAMSSAVQAVELACSIAGTTAFRATSPLERCFRDVQTMRHHVFASEQRFGTFGQVCLEVPPDFPVVASSASLKVYGERMIGDLSRPRPSIAPFKP